MPLVIVLTGPSCAGKTSLARALQTALPEPALHIEADRVFPALPDTHPRWAYRRHRAALTVALHESIATWARAGFDLIVDGALPYGHPALRADCLRVLEPYAPRLVGVTCAVAELAARERARHVAHPGWAVRQARDVNDGLVLDATVDSSTADPARCAQSVLEQLRR